MEIFDNLKEQFAMTEIIRRKNLSYDLENGKQRVGMYLFFTILENSAACIRLIEFQYRSALGILLRNLLEAYVDLINLEKNENYLLNMSSYNIKQDIQLLKNAKKYCFSPYFKGVWDKYKTSNNIDKAITDLEKEKKAKHLEINERFEKANMRELYMSVYNTLCRASHNNISALIDRSYNTDDNDQAFKQLTKYDYNLYCSTISGILAGSLENIYKIIDKSEDEDLKRIISFYEKSEKLCK